MDTDRGPGNHGKNYRIALSLHRLISKLAVPGKKEYWDIGNKPAGTGNFFK
jgi:hypothetical protein